MTVFKRVCHNCCAEVQKEFPECQNCEDKVKGEV